MHESTFDSTIFRIIVVFYLKRCESDRIRQKIRFYDDITVSDELSIRRAQKPRIIPDDQNSKHRRISKKKTLRL